MSNVIELQERISQLERSLDTAKRDYEVAKAMDLLAQEYAIVAIPNSLQDAAARAKLLNEAASKPIVTMVQLDYFNQETGAVGYTGAKYEFFGPMLRQELNNSDCLRMLVPMHYSRADILNGLEKFKAVTEQMEADIYADVAFPF